MQYGEVLVVYYVLVDVFFFLSLIEIFGNVVVEVMVSGLFVVVFDIVVVGMYVCSYENGWFVFVGDVVLFMQVVVVFVINVGLWQCLG